MKENISLDGFVARACLRRYGCELKTTKSTVTGPKGKEEWKYLKRGERIGVLPNIEGHEFLTPNQLRSLVADLNLPAKDFGFEFG